MSSSEEENFEFEDIDIESRQTKRTNVSFEMSHPFDTTSDCFDDFDGRAVCEPFDVKERRENGQTTLLEQVKAFDSRAVFYSSIFLFEWLVFLWWPPLFLAFCVVVVLPLLLFYTWWRSIQKECSLATVVHALGRGFYDVTFMMICASYGALIIGLMVLFWFYDAGAFKKNDEKSKAFVFYVFVFLPFVTSEEFFKAMFVRLQQRKLQASSPDDVTRAHLVHSTGTSVGYAISQAMGWVVVAHITLLNNDVYLDDVWRQIWSLLLVGICVTIFGTPLQLLSGYLIGLEVTRNKWKSCGASLLVPTALRFTYYISAVGWLLLVESVVVALILFFATNVYICGLMLYRVKQVEAQMPPSYLRRVGYLNWGGYGLIDIIDDDGDDGTGINTGVGDEPPLDLKPKLRAPRKEDVSVVEMKAQQTPVETTQVPTPIAAPGSIPKPQPPAATRNSVLARLEALKAQKVKPAKDAGNSELFSGVDVDGDSVVI
mmetsp:Transcript_32712/g.38361  ORF Transcript_32712/g.38361 Transcript_32712/m.38361 type:complete len:486 (+) Transcript_32712:69-1526(+)|eukprot:CAMPEP_0114337030 /NCGR_PEP_ID=MMETSP0101-20121206/6096_1 /TAXON_ID=38822 ORGANISM="Pteridomonas danica, Strain PT" /NCGR_SAMPLE_ID=MMETSP0101 /ASSEMBLY_ACC=CAM_ASM_000211 /LENGTH=485 /DNA_ID=CAMNT_0001469139 /DNA_START=1 /DNA_END=1458 /DNA_ORIENTATION=-